MPGPQRFTIFSGSTVAPQRLTLNNREYLTAPAVLLVCGVLNDGLVLSDVLDPESWNGMPIVIDHPYDATGQPISARDPAVLAACGVGHVYRARLGTGTRNGHQVASLQAELWIDIAQATALGAHAVATLAQIESQTAMDISTGFYSVAQETPGTFYGQSYSIVHRDVRPDHLALLPTSTGACSWQDGCGVPRLNQAQGCACQHKETPMEHPPASGWRGFLATLRQFVTGAEQALATQATDTDLREALYGALARELGADYSPCFIESLQVEDQTFTYRQGERLKQRAWTVGEDGLIVLGPEVTDVQRSTDYVPVPDTTAPSPQPQEPTPMPPTANAVQVRVNSLISDPLTQWSENERHLLEALPEATLILLEAQPKLQPPPSPSPERTMEDLLATASPEEQESWREARETIARRKQAAIATLVANKAPFTEEDLRTKTAEHLESLVAFGASSQAQAAAADYRGRGVPAQRQTPEELEVPEAPRTLDLVIARQRELGLRR